MTTTALCLPSLAEEGSALMTTMDDALLPQQRALLLERGSSMASSSLPLTKSQAVVIIAQ